MKRSKFWVIFSVVAMLAILAAAFAPMTAYAGNGKGGGGDKGGGGECHGKSCDHGNGGGGNEGGNGQGDNGKNNADPDGGGKNDTDPVEDGNNGCGNSRNADGTKSDDNNGRCGGGKKNTPTPPPTKTPPPPPTPPANLVVPGLGKNPTTGCLGKESRVYTNMALPWYLVEDVSAGSMITVTLSVGRLYNEYVDVSPDGCWLLHANREGDLFRQPIYGGAAVQITKTPNVVESEPIYGNNWLISNTANYGKGVNVVEARFEGQKPWLVASDASRPGISPDDQWVTFTWADGTLGMATWDGTQPGNFSQSGLWNAWLPEGTGLTIKMGDKFGIYVFAQDKILSTMEGRSLAYRPAGGNKYALLQSDGRTVKLSTGAVFQLPKKYEFVTWWSPQRARYDMSSYYLLFDQAK